MSETKKSKAFTNPTPYILSATAVSFVIGVVVTRKLCVKTTLTEAQVIAAWLTKMNESGFQVFATDPNLSKTVIDAAAKAA